MVSVKEQTEWSEKGCRKAKHLLGLNFQGHGQRSFLPNQIWFTTLQLTTATVQRVEYQNLIFTIRDSYHFAPEKALKYSDIRDSQLKNFTRV